MDSGGRIEKINSTAINVGNTQATSTDKALAEQQSDVSAEVHDFPAMVRFPEPSRLLGVIT